MWLNLRSDSLTIFRAESTCRSALVNTASTLQSAIDRIDELKKQNYPKQQVDEVTELWELYVGSVEGLLKILEDDDFATAKSLLSADANQTLRELKAALIEAEDISGPLETLLDVPSRVTHAGADRLVDSVWQQVTEAPNLARDLARHLQLLSQMYQRR